MQRSSVDGSNKNALPLLRDNLAYLQAETAKERGRSAMIQSGQPTHYRTRASLLNISLLETSRCFLILLLFDRTKLFGHLRVVLRM
jgi:hypothetical protein